MLVYRANTLQASIFVINWTGLQLYNLQLSIGRQICESALYLDRKYFGPIRTENDHVVRSGTNSRWQRTSRNTYRQPSANGVPCWTVVTRKLTVESVKAEHKDM